MTTTSMPKACPSRASSPEPAVPVSWTERCIVWSQGGLKIADLGHLQAPWAIHKEWVERMEEEQFRQGDMEKQLRLPVSPLMDRTGSGITKMQVRGMLLWDGCVICSASHMPC